MDVLIAFISTAIGFFLKWVWDWGTKKVEDGQKAKDSTLQEKVEIIGEELKSRLSSLEFRHKEFEQTFLQVKTEFTDFRKDVVLALKAQKESANKLYEGVKEIIIKADERYEKMQIELKFLSTTVNKIDWKKYGK